MKNVPDRPQFDFQEVIDRASRRRQNAAKIPYSDHAFEELKEQISAYAEELIDESVKKAKQHRAESVSSADVQQANQYLVASPSHRIYRHVGTFGGLLFGTALSSMVSMITADQYRLMGVVVTFIITFIGGFSIAIHIVKNRELHTRLTLKRQSSSTAP
jgi:histone H3/H4